MIFSIRKIFLPIFIGILIISGAAVFFLQEKIAPFLPVPAEPFQISEEPFQISEEPPLEPLAKKAYLKKAELLKIQETQGTEAALDALDQIIPEGELTLAKYLAATSLGRKAYSQSNDFNQALAYITQDRSLAYPLVSGYTAGVFQAFFEEQKYTQSINELGEKLCGKYYGLDPFDPALDWKTQEEAKSCFAGLGQAIMFVNQNDIFKSLDLCDQLASFFARRWCPVGVFFWNAFLLSEFKDPQEPLPSPSNIDPVSLCARMKEEHRFQCAASVGLAQFLTDFGNFKRAFEECQKLEKQYQDICLGVIGRFIISPFFKDDIEKMNEACLLAGSENIGLCISAVSSGIKLWNKGELGLAFQFCDKVEKQFREQCRQAISL